MASINFDGTEYFTGPYNYSTRFTYAAYCASWAPQYFTGAPLGDYAGATVLPKITNVKLPKVLRSGIAPVRKAISVAGVHQEPTMDPKALWRVPNIMLMNVEDPTLEPLTDFDGVIAAATLSTPPATGEKRKRTTLAESGDDEAEMAADRRQESSDESESEDEAPAQRRRLSTRRSSDSDSEHDGVSAQRVRRRAPVLPSRRRQVQDGLEMDEVLARRLQFQENYGSRGRARVSRRAERFAEL